MTWRNWLKIKGGHSWSGIQPSGSIDHRDNWPQRSAESPLRPSGYWVSCTLYFQMNLPSGSFTSADCLFLDLHFCQMQSNFCTNSSENGRFKKQNNKAWFSECFQTHHCSACKKDIRRIQIWDLFSEIKLRQSKLQNCVLSVRLRLWFLQRKTPGRFLVLSKREKCTEKELNQEYYAIFLFVVGDSVCLNQGLFRSIFFSGVL